MIIAIARVILGIAKIKIYLPIKFKRERDWLFIQGRCFIRALINFILIVEINSGIKEHYEEFIFVEYFNSGKSFIIAKIIIFAKSIKFKEPILEKPMIFWRISKEFRRTTIRTLTITLK